MTQFPASKKRSMLVILFIAYVPQCPRDILHVALILLLIFGNFEMQLQGRLGTYHHAPYLAALVFSRLISKGALNAQMCILRRQTVCIAVLDLVFHILRLACHVIDASKRMS